MMDKIYHSSANEMDDLNLLQSSGFFNIDWYLIKYPDVAEAKVDPMIHFLYNGGFEGRDPGPEFSSKWYLNTYLDVKEAGVNPLIHYLRYGKKEGRTALPPRVDDLTLLQSSPLFDKTWYLEENPDVAEAKVDAAIHFLYAGGTEGRAPSPAFSSKWYLNIYLDVKEAGINPLIHYLRFGREEGRVSKPQEIEFVNAQYKCPICKKPVPEFVPLPVFYMENTKKYGYPYTPYDAETLNVQQYSCPHCGASDRDRLYACYLDKRMPQYHDRDGILLLDVAPSYALGRFIKKFKQITRITADLLVEGTDLVVDITNMPEVDSNSYDILICSHVLEHVSDDNKALAELYRILKSGGWGIIMVPIILPMDKIDEDPQVTDVAERWRRFGQDDHVRLYNKSGFVSRLQSANFIVSQLGMEYFGEAAFKQYGISSKSVLYVVKKI